MTCFCHRAFVARASCPWYSVARASCPWLFFVSCCLALSLSAGSNSAVRAADFLVTTTGKADGDGSRAQPWDLATALSHPPAVMPGDTIWMDGGTYPGAFVSRLVGTAEHPIIVRALPGVRATIDCLAPLDRTRLFEIAGDHVTFWGLEVTCSDPKRVTQLGGSWPVDLNRGGIHCRASHARFINLVVHDSGGIGFWSGGEGGEVYGSLFYHNGWKGPDRGHGHGIYAQNQLGTKRLADNIIFNQFGDGIHVYGSSKAFLKGFDIVGNISFNNGSLNGGGERTRNLLIGGDSPAERIRITENATYHSELMGTSVQVGYGTIDEDAVVEDNYIVGMALVRSWKKLSFKRNTLVGAYSLVLVEASPEVTLSGYAWDQNTYLSGEVQYSPLAFKHGDAALALNWTDWREKVGLDAGGAYVKGPPTGTKVFVRPNAYEPGRANVAVYNWDKADYVEIDLSGLLKSGQSYKIVSAQDFFGPSVAEGTYDVQPVRVPMSPRAGVHPIGMDDFELPITEPEFAVFVVLPEAAPAPPIK